MSRSETDDRGAEQTPRPDEATSQAERDAAALAARVELLEAETDRLRQRYAAARKARYRRTALGLVGLGLLAGAGGWLFPDTRTVLLVLAAIGLFGGLLTYYLTPERFVAADVATRVYRTLADNATSLAGDLGLTDYRVYVPRAAAGAGEGEPRRAPVRLFVPQRETYEIPDPGDLDRAIVVPEEPAGRGLALIPTGAGLYPEFERTLTGEPAARPGPLLDQLADALVEAFELVEDTEIDLDAEVGRATVEFNGSAYESGFDTPSASLIAVGLAMGLETPVTAEPVPPWDGGWGVTCRWDPDAVAEDQGDAGT